MNATFIGADTFKVDGKGRVSIPADFRKVIDAGDAEREPGSQPSFILVYGNETRNFLEAFPISVHRDLMAKVERMPRGSARRKGLERFYSGYASKITLDDTGRIVLPKKIREKIGIEDEAFFIADNDTFQIWKPETFKEDFEATPDDDFDPDVDPSIYIPGDEF